MQSDQSGENQARKNKRDRYWSVMLVGDHGKIIPFRRFKGLAIGAIGLLIFSIAALIVLSILFAQQRQTIAQLQSDLETVQQQARQLKHEKDLYLTQLVVKQEQKAGPSKPAPLAKKAPVVPPAVEEPADPPPKPKAAVKKAPPKPAPPAVKWAADIRRFKATYFPEQQVLRAEFRIYNTSKPKKQLKGRTVVVFKNLDDTPIHWFPVPTVQLSHGEPSGKRGQPFKINNYRTVRFRAYGQKAPVKFNTATVFIFNDKGEMLVSKDFAFKIAYTPPKEPEKPKAPPQPSVQTSVPPASPTPSPKRDGDSGHPLKTTETPTVVPDASRQNGEPAATPAGDGVLNGTPDTPTASEDTPAVTQDQPPAADIQADETPANPNPPANAPETDQEPKTQGVSSEGQP